jgi:hypothetical protein
MPKREQIPVKVAPEVEAPWDNILLLKEFIDRYKPILEWFVAHQTEIKNLASDIKQVQAKLQYITSSFPSGD